MSALLVIGVGNPDCGDDAVGPLVAREIAARALPGVDVVISPPDGLALLDVWRDAGRVVIVDAAVSGAAPGAVHELDAAAAPLPGHLRQISSHGFGIREVVELARALGRLPARLTVYGVEGRDFEPGRTMSGPVQAAAAALVEALCTSAR